MRRPEALTLLRHRRFAFFFAGRTISIIGSSMSAIALTFAVLDISDSASALGLVLAANTIPMVVFLLIGGVVADRMSRSLVMQASHLLSAVSQGTIAILLLTGTAEIWMLVVIGVFAGTVQAFTWPAMQGIVPLVVPREQIQQANALLSFSRASIVVLGPSIGGVLVVTIGSGWALAVDAASFVIAALLMAQLQLPPATLGGDGDQPSMLHDLKVGWSAFTSITWIWVVVLAFGLLNMIQIGAWNMLGPVIAVDTIGKAQWGWVLSSEAAGLLVMTLVMMRVRLRYPVRAGMIGMCCMAFPILVLGLPPHVLPLMALAFAAGMGVEVFSIGWQTAYHEHVPNEILSRVASYDALGSFVAIPIGQLLYGPLSTVFDRGDVLVVSGVVYIVIALSTLLSRSVRDLGRAELSTDARARRRIRSPNDREPRRRRRRDAPTEGRAGTLLDREHHGDTFVDDYEWLRDKDESRHHRLPRGRERLHGEPDGPPGRPARADLRRDQAAHPGDRPLVPSRRGSYWYYSPHDRGAAVPARVPDRRPGRRRLDAAGPRRPASPVPGEQVLVDGNALAEGHDFFALGAASRLPRRDPARLLYRHRRATSATSVQFKDLSTGELLPERSRAPAHGSTWSPSRQPHLLRHGRRLLAARQIWRHDVRHRHRRPTCSCTTRPTAGSGSASAGARPTAT